MRKGAALVVVMCFLVGSTGCLIKGWDKGYGQSYTSAMGEIRTIPVGSRYDASFVPGTGMMVQLTSQKLCRKAVVGRLADVQEWWREENGNNAYVIVSGIVLFPLFPYMVGAYLYNRHQMKK